MRKQNHLRRICVTPPERLIEMNLTSCCGTAKLDVLKQLGLEFRIWSKERCVDIVYPFQGFSDGGAAQVLLDDVFLSKKEGVYSYEIRNCDKRFVEGHIELKCPKLDIRPEGVKVSPGNPALLEPDGLFEGECP